MILGDSTADFGKCQVTEADLEEYELFDRVAVRQQVSNYSCLALLDEVFLKDERVELLRWVFEPMQEDFHRVCMDLAPMEDDLTDAGSATREQLLQEGGLRGSDVQLGELKATDPFAHFEHFFRDLLQVFGLVHIVLTDAVACPPTVWHLSDLALLEHVLTVALPMIQVH